MKISTKPLLLAALTVAAGPLAAATSVWNASLNFGEFAGMPGGFEPGAAILAAGGGSVQRPYDVLRPVGVEAGSGMAVFGTGQDGLADLTIRTSVLDGSQGRWAALRAAKSLSGGYTAGATIEQGTSRPGDYGLVALEFQFATGLTVTADQFALRLTSANGTSEAYEWTMVTVGTADEAPFSLGLLASYDPADYTDLGSSSYYNATGGLTGLAGTGQRLATGRSVSQFLSGAPAAPVSGGMVQPGWYAVDDFNAWLFDGPESDWDNPYAEAGTLDGNPLITGAALGLAPDTRITGFTVWVGVHDIGLDSNGDGFTSTDGNPFVTVAQLSLGSSAVTVPEPSGAALAGLAAIWLARRKRD